MPAIGKFNAWIELEGRRLTEYASVLDEKASSVTSHIASKEGKNFALCFSHNLELKNGIRAVAKIYVDGVQTNHLILESGKSTRCEGTLVQPTLMRKFQFTILPRSSSVNRQSSMSRAENLGTITIIFRLARVEELSGFQPFRTSAAVDQIRPVHEMVQKATRHYTSFGPEVSTGTPHGPVCISSLKKYPPMSVKYVYAPKVLIAKGIIPIRIAHRPAPATPSTPVSKLVSSNGWTAGFFIPDDPESQSEVGPAWTDDSSVRGSMKKKYFN